MTKFGYVFVGILLSIVSFIKMILEFNLILNRKEETSSLALTYDLIIFIYVTNAAYYFWQF